MHCGNGILFHPVNTSIRVSSRAGCGPGSQQGGRRWAEDAEHREGQGSAIVGEPVNRRGTNVVAQYFSFRASRFPLSGGSFLQSPSRRPIPRAFTTSLDVMASPSRGKLRSGMVFQQHLLSTTYRRRSVGAVCWLGARTSRSTEQRPPPAEKLGTACLFCHLLQCRRRQPPVQHRGPSRPLPSTLVRVPACHRPRSARRWDRIAGPPVAADSGMGVALTLVEAIRSASASAPAGYR